MKVKCLKDIGSFKKDKVYDITINSGDNMKSILIASEYNNPLIIENHEYNKYFEITIEQKVENLENQIKELKEELHKQQIENDSKKVWWTPKNGDKYWYVNSQGNILETTYEGYMTEDFDISIGNCFETKEQAERELFERQLRFKLKKFAYENNDGEVDWKDGNQQKYSIFYKNESDDLAWDCSFIFNHYGKIYFLSKEAVEKAIETFKDDLIRYFTTDK